jgi:hypothetical protein
MKYKEADFLKTGFRHSTNMVGFCLEGHVNYYRG